MRTIDWKRVYGPALLATLTIILTMFAEGSGVVVLVQAFGGLATLLALLWFFEGIRTVERVADAIQIRTLFSTRRVELPVRLDARRHERKRRTRTGTRTEVWYEIVVVREGVDALVASSGHTDALALAETLRDLSIALDIPARLAETLPGQQLTERGRERGGADLAGAQELAERLIGEAYEGAEAAREQIDYRTREPIEDARGRLLDRARETFERDADPTAVELGVFEDALFARELEDQ